MSWDARRERAQVQIEEIAERRASAEEERERLADAPVEFARRRRALADEFAAAEAARKEAADALAAAETALADADRAARVRRWRRWGRRASPAPPRRRGSRRPRPGAPSSCRRLRPTSTSSPTALRRWPAPRRAQPCRRSPTSSSKLDSLRQERERLGAVNLRADEELAEVEGARDKLIAERDDLTEAIRKLRGAIGSLNQEGRERLLAAFDVVNGHFQSLFSTLFEGGEAELLLVESDDPLQAGLELLAKPPGKKPQTLTLLSGGEQALTAMSLIFAVFLTNPSPICVLDEVDAPLDDYNVERFCDLLEEMRKRSDTRFVTITHNPITMARMDRLFGVTMAERGVSQIVSVELAEAERMLEAG